MGGEEDGEDGEAAGAQAIKIKAFHSQQLRLRF